MTTYRLVRKVDGKPLLKPDGKLYGIGEPPPVATVYPNGYAKRLVGSASRLLIPATMAGFPLLMRAKHPDLRLAPTGFVRNGKDFRVESLSGVNYPYHVHKYDGTTGLIELVAYAPLAVNSANPLAIYFDQVGVNGEDLKGSWGNKALAAYHLPDLSDYSGNARHLGANTSPTGEYDLGPDYTVRWTKQAANPSVGVLTQKSVGVELKAGAAATVTDGDIFVFARKAPPGNKWTFSFDYTQLDTIIDSTGAGVFTRLGLIRGEGAGGIEADPNAWSAADAGDLSDGKMSDNAAATGGGVRASINTINDDNPTNQHRIRMRRYTGTDPGTLPDVPPDSGLSNGDPFTFKSGTKYRVSMERNVNKLIFKKTATGETTETSTFTSTYINDIVEAWIFVAAVNGRRFLIENATMAVGVTPVMTWRAGGNLAGAEFGDGVGDVLGTHYIMPTNAEITYYASKGMRVMRVPFLFRRILQTADMTALLALADFAATKSVYLLLDPHEYGMINKVPVSDPTARTAFVNYWTSLANATKAKTNIIYGLMNEPMKTTVVGGISATDWLAAANPAIAAIRATGATQVILVPGTDWTGGHSWLDNNAAVMGGVVDPLNKFIYEIHQYVDSDYSGTHRDAKLGSGSTVLVNVTNWARGLGKQLFLGEFGFAVPEGNVEAKALMDYMDANRDVWAGWTYWAGGQWWGEYMFTIEPLNLTTPVDRPQMAFLTPHLAA